MNTQSILRKGLNVLTAIVFIAGIAFSQTLNLAADITGTGTTNANGNVVNTTAAVITINGTLNLRSNASLQGLNTSSTGTFSINRLDLTRNGNKELNTGVTVTNILSYGNGSNVFNSVFDINTRTLSVANTTQIVGTPGASAALTLTDGTVAYTNATSQTIFNTNAFSGPISYGTLNLSGAGTFTLPDASSTVTAATVSHTGGALTVNDDFTITGTGSFGTIATIAASQVMNFSSTTAASTITGLTTAAGTLRKSGDQNLTITTVSDVASGGTVEHTTAGGTLTVSTLSDNHGTIQSTSSGTVAFTNNITNNNTISTATGTLDFNGTGTQTNTGGTITVSGAGNALFAGDIAANPGTLTFNAASTVTYDGASQNLATGITYGNLVAGGSGAKTAGANLTVGGNLTLTQNITQSSGSLTLTSTTAANVLGTGEVIGSLRRNHSFTSGSAYAFNRSNVQLTFGTTGAGDMTINMQPADAPTNPVTGKYVQRSYAFSGSTPGNLTAAKLYYTAGEFSGVTAENRLGIRTYNGTNWSKLFFGGYSRTAAGGEVTLTSLDNSLAGVTELGLFQITLGAAASTAWATASTWDEGVTPTSDDDVEIGAFTVTVGADVTLTDRPASLTLLTGGSLNLSGGSFATIGDLDVLNNATITSSSGRTLTAVDATFNSSGTSNLSGSIAFATLTNSNTGTLNLAGGTITTSISNASTMSVAGALTVSSGGANASTQTNGALTISGASGNLTFGSTGGVNLASLNISGGTLTIDNAGGQLTTYGDLTVGSGVTVSNSGTITVGE